MGLFTLKSEDRARVAPVIRCPAGVFADGAAWDLPLSEWHVLLAGLSGAGKSSTLRTILVAAAQRPDVALVLLDPKFVEFGGWRPRAEVVASERDHIAETLDRCADVIDARYRRLERAGRDRHVPTADDPLILLVVDELAACVASGDPKFDKGNGVNLRHILERGRAASVLLIAATQRPSADVIPSNLRDLFGLRIAHAMANAASTQMILAEAAAMAPAHELSLSQPGQAYVLAEGDRRGRLARSYWCPTEHVARVASACAHLKHTADVLTTEAELPSAASEFTRAGLHTDPNRSEAVSSPTWPAPTLQPSRPIVPPQSDRPEPSTDDLTDDEAKVLAALARGPVPAGRALEQATALPQGRARRAAQALETRGRIHLTSAGWITS